MQLFTVKYLDKKRKLQMNEMELVAAFTDYLYAPFVELSQLKSIDITTPAGRVHIEAMKGDKRGFKDKA